MKHRTQAEWDADRIHDLMFACVMEALRDLAGLLLLVIAGWVVF